MSVERERFRAAERSDLAGEVKWVAEEDGDGDGADLPGAFVCDGEGEADFEMAPPLERALGLLVESWRAGFGGEAG